MVKKNKKYDFDLITPADEVEYDPLESKNGINEKLPKLKSKNRFFINFKKLSIIPSAEEFTGYFLILFISFSFGFVRWFLLERDLPLFSLSEQQIKSMKIKEISQKQVDTGIDYNLVKEIALNKLFPVIDARDIESFGEGHIENAVNIDSELLLEGDEVEFENYQRILKDIINQNHDKILIYCWNPDCERAEYLKAIILDESGDYGSFYEYFEETQIMLYHQGWDEWISMESGI